MSKQQPAKYLQVAALIEERIEKRSYQAGDKLPSIRELSTTLSLSKNTIIRAYQQLEGSGKITAASRSGFVVSTPHAPVKPRLNTPKYVDLMGLSKTIMNLPTDKNVVSFGSAHPDTEFPAIRSLYAEIGRHSRYQHHIPSHYQLPPGNEHLLKQLVAVNRELGITTSVDELLITNGAQQAISLSLQAITRPGDIVLVESPSYFGNLLLLESLGLKVVEVPASSHDGMDLHALQQVLTRWQVKAIITNPSFNNPTGYLMPTQKRLEFLALTTGIPIIEDDVFGGLAYQSRPLPLRALDSENRVIYCNSLSKTLDSRLRIGWVIAGKYQDTIEKRLMTDNMGSPNLMHSAVGEFLSTGKYRQHLGKIRRSYAKKQKLFHQRLSHELDQYSHLQGHYHLSLPQGGFLCWLTLPEGIDGLTLFHQALEKGISILPGEMFSTHQHHRHCLRLSFATYEDTPKWQAALAGLASIIAEQ
ncbi:PLP-dependent aminotransferase family protein [Photobacterium sanctipauli]|uniref:PLP-dependent aminotransferase family protein n=1 Tax=Photobacterium sanctipauli TaxID=1342794 RepID=A0A2T3NY59_9GAMM|nr:PLP-dependent aminotransferase family protein [Photobacterium sanctipauli]PSW21233.1 PLP-dependent aminotransferase family protein [Photobacterium sanctipauli]